MDKTRLFCQLLVRELCLKIGAICENFYQGFSVSIDSNRYQESPKKFYQFFQLRKTQGDHALFRAWEFFRKINKNSDNRN